MSLPLAGKRIGFLTASASRLGGGVFEAVVAQAEIVAVCGGVPIVFPWSGPRAGQSAPGFARLTEWTPDSATTSAAGDVVVNWDGS